MAEQRDQEDVLRKKDNVTKSSIGLQLWGDEARREGPMSMTGTADRAARIAKGQMGSDEDTAGSEITRAPHEQGKRAKGQLGDDADEA